MYFEIRTMKQVLFSFLICSLLISCTKNVDAIEGEPSNIKLTSPASTDFIKYTIAQGTIIYRYR